MFITAATDKFTQLIINLIKILLRKKKRYKIHLDLKIHNPILNIIKKLFTCKKFL